MLTKELNFLIFIIKLLFLPFGIGCFPFFRIAVCNYWWIQHSRKRINFIIRYVSMVFPLSRDLPLRHLFVLSAIHLYFHFLDSFYYFFLVSVWIRNHFILVRLNLFSYYTHRHFAFLLKLPTVLLIICCNNYRLTCSGDLFHLRLPPLFLLIF